MTNNKKLVKIEDLLTKLDALKDYFTKEEQMFLANNYNFIADGVIDEYCYNKIYSLLCKDYCYIKRKGN